MIVTSEGPVKVTKATVGAAWRRRAKDRRLIVRDKDCRGLALIVNATAMAWVFSYRPRGADPLTGRRWPNRTVTLGNPASKSPDDARIEANRLKGEAKAGGDPAIERKARAEDERRKRGETLGKLADSYERVLPGRQKMRGTGQLSPDYVTLELASLRAAIAVMEASELPVAELAAAKVRELIDGDAGINARARFGALSRFLDWCQDVGHIMVNPCSMVARSRRPKAHQPRARYLTPAQLGRLWNAAEQLREPVWRDFVRFLIALPCRRGEAASIEWSHIDLAASEWRQPGKLTKNREPHRLHLHPLALDVLRARQAAYQEAQADSDAKKVSVVMTDWQPGEGLVFPGSRRGKPLDVFTALKRDLSEAAGISDWTWHDFRRSFATALGEAAIPEAVADAVLNHRQAATRGGVLGVYQRASRWPEQVKAMQAWGRILQAAIEGREAVADVVPLPVRA